MMLRDLRDVTTLDIAIFVNVDEVKSNKSKPSIDFAGRSYVAVQDEFFYPDGLEFESKFETFEVERIKCKFYEKSGKEVVVIEAYLG